MNDSAAAMMKSVKESRATEGLKRSRRDEALRGLGKKTSWLCW